MDLTRLTPAPWVAEGRWVSGRTPGCRPNGEIIARCESSLGEGYWHETNAEFIALARNFFDVMMRRGWSVWPPANGIRWKVNAPTASMDNWTFKNEFDDPLTALVEADRWYRENIEKHGTVH
jgi:hypothetical protein